jgi:hypothetical protein
MVKYKNTSEYFTFRRRSDNNSRNEDQLQRALHKLNVISKMYTLMISTQKTKIMTFKGKFPVRSKINIDNCPLEQVKHFNYLGCDVTYDQDEDVNNKLHKFKNICATAVKGCTRMDHIRNEEIRTELEMYAI